MTWDHSHNRLYY